MRQDSELAEDRFCLFGKLVEQRNNKIIDHKQTTTKNKTCKSNHYHQMSTQEKDKKSTQVMSSSKQHPIMIKYQILVDSLTRKLRHHHHQFSHQTKSSSAMLIAFLATSLAASVCLQPVACSSALPLVSPTNQIAHSSQLTAQARAGGLDPSDYIDEAGELDIMANQQQIPTAQLMSAAGHIVPENFFLPGGSIPAIHSRYNSAIAALIAQQQQQHHHQQQQQQVAASLSASKQQQQQQDQDPLQVAASHVHARHVISPVRAPVRAQAPLDLLVAAAAAEQQQNEQVGSLIDFNGYNLAASPDGRDGPAQMDLAEFLGVPSVNQQHQQHHHHHSQQALYEQQLAAAQQQASHERQMEQLAAMASNQQGQVQSVAEMHSPTNDEQQQQQASAEHYMASPIGQVGPDYQVEAGQEYSTSYSNNNEQQAKSNGDKQQQQQQRPFGLPTKSSNKEPSGMLKPLGNPKTVSSPAIDFVANNLPKTSTFEKLAEKLPAPQTPTLFSFSSSKDPMEKVKGVNQKKRNVMRQAEQMARMLIKSINDKFGTTLGDQSDIPFLLSSLGPLGFAQNLLFDPTLLVTLLNSAEKTYFSDVLPGPAKSAIRPVLNLFRVPNKKRDKANLLNIISYLTSGGQTGSSTPSKHRQSFGIEKSANKNKKDRR